MFVVFTDGDKPELVPRKSRDVAPADDSTAPCFLAEVERAGSTHERVVHVKERHNGVLARDGRRELVHRHYSRVVPSTILTLIGKPGCHLCDDARTIITRVIAELPPHYEIEVIERSIVDDDDLHAKYWDEIPVVLINDRVHTIWRVEPERLSAALLEETE